MSSRFKSFGRSLAGVSALCVSLGLAGAASAQTGGQPNQVASTQPAADRALTATEQTAVSAMLNQINALSGPALQNEVARLAKLYSDQNLNLVGIVKAVKTASGNKLGAVNRAMSAACGASAAGSAAAAAICEAAAVTPDDAGGANRRDVAGLPTTTGIDTAGIGGGAGAGGAGAGGGLAGLTGGTGTGTGNGSGSTGTGGAATGSGGAQTYSSFASTTGGSSGGVGKSVSTR